MLPSLVYDRNNFWSIMHAKSRIEPHFTPLAVRPIRLVMALLHPCHQRQDVLHRRRHNLQEGLELPECVHEAFPITGNALKRGHGKAFAVAPTRGEPLLSPVAYREI